MTFPMPDTGGGFQQQAEDPSNIAVARVIEKNNANGLTITH